MHRLAILTLTLLTAMSAPASPSWAQTTVYRPNTRTQTDTTTITVPYATNGRTRVWSYRWNAAGQLLSVDGPLPGTGDTIAYAYTAAGYLRTVTNQLGHVTTVTAWNGRGQPATIVDANGTTTLLTYDIQDRVLSATIDPGAAQSQYVFTYDAVGNLTRMTNPTGGYLAYTYDDASRLTLVTNDRGQNRTLNKSFESY